MKPKYPIYIVSKGRWKLRYTSEALKKMGIFHYMVIEKQEYKKYVQFIDKSQILILPNKYLKEYNTCDNYGMSKSVGPGAARNFCWDHSLENGDKRHWVLDDNIYKFMRLNSNKRYYCNSSSIFSASDDFVDRYKNVPLAGMNYINFAHDRVEMPPFKINTRIYSCLLIENNINYRWRGRYNEDTDLSIRVLRDGYCTILFNAFLIDKTGTQRMRGGNSKEFYDIEGTLPKSQMIVDLHPDIAKLSWRFNRWHHYINYSSFKKNKLIKKKNLTIPKGINNYGMVLKCVKKI